MSCTPLNASPSAPAPLCTYCHVSAELLPGATVGARSELIWACLHCRAWVGVWPDSAKLKPMGILAKAKLRAMHLQAQVMFDRMWKDAAATNGWNERVARRRAYQWLAKQLGMTYDDHRHIGFFDERDTQRVIEILEGFAGRRAA